MTQNLNAIYENGTFRPEIGGQLSLADGARVRLTVESLPTANTKDVLSLCSAVYDGLTAEEIAEIERIALDRSSFFTE